MFPINLFTFSFHSQARTVSVFCSIYSAIMFVLTMVMIITTICLSIVIRRKADEKDVTLLMNKKADKTALDDLKEFLKEQKESINSRLDDLKTLIVELVKK